MCDSVRLLFFFFFFFFPKEGTRVRILGVYHNMAWYSAVGHRGSRGRGSGVVVGERRSGIW